MDFSFCSEKHLSTDISPSVHCTCFLSYLRGKSGIDFGPQVVRIEYEHANHKGKKHHNKEDHELEDILHSPAQRDLQGAEALIRREDVRNAGEAEHDGDGIEAFRYDLRVRREPLISG